MPQPSAPQRPTATPLPRSVKYKPYVPPEKRTEGSLGRAIVIFVFGYWIFGTSTIGSRR